MKITGTFPNIRLRRVRKSAWIRRLISESNLSADDLDKPKRSLDLEPSPDTTKNPIQNPISSKKGWCLVGEYQGKRGCIEIGEYDKCLSGQVFPEEKLCLNPTFTQYTLTH